MSRALITRTAFSRMAGITQGAVTQLFANGKPLSKSLVGKKIDPTHPACVEYLAARAEAGKLPEPPPEPPAAGRAKRKPPPPEGPAAEPAPPALVALDLVPENIREMADKPLRELVEIFGTAEQFVDWLKAIKEMEIVHEKRLKNAREEGTVIGRQLVADRIVDPINTMHERLMSDGARTMASDLHAMGGAGRTEAEFEEYIVDFMGAFVRALKPKIVRAVRDA